MLRSFYVFIVGISMGFEGLFKGMYGLDGTLNGLVWGIQE